jgi:hypothetical protein
MMIGTKKRVRFLIHLAIGFTMLVVSSCRNVTPSWSIDVAAPVQTEDLRRIEGIAASLGFVRVKIPFETMAGSGGHLEFLETWRWSAHNSTYIHVVRVVPENRYRIEYLDIDTDGENLHGPACTHYLEFIDNLNRAFGQERYRLSYLRASCDSDGQ